MKGGLVGVIANDFARSSLFTSAVWNLEVPDGWKKEMLIGGDWCGARNTLVRTVLDEGYSHLWFMDDDHAFPADMLVKLLQHDLPLVTPICLTRVWPFAPVQYTEHLGGNQYLPIPLSQSETDGLVRLEAGGCAGMLIRRDVLETVEPPWFEYTDRSEDIVFSEKVREAGFEIWCDLSLRLGHITTAVVWPAVSDDGWKTGLTIGRNLNLVVDAADDAVRKEAERPPSMWTWTLKRMLTDERVVVLYAPEWQNIAWQPEPGQEPEGVLQWWVDEHNGSEPHPVGDPFSYVKEDE